ncbi:MAG TPA: thiamine pyrophosphate-dependent dehydrogenase E1 component subunit alpha [Fimbriimonadaceae bacterium]|nr:thiamine pyrophosphate-dependent dehydrogenase E1 component subunit alpha [Fimbriimonadaceae bacterium]
MTEANVALDKQLAEPGVSGAPLRQLFETMVRIATWEQRLLQFMSEGHVAAGFYHPGRGHEAIAAGACETLRRDDYIMYDHRGCGHVIAKGVPLTAIFGDFLENVAGSTRGMGAGIVHIADPSVGVLGQSGTLGASFPIAAGAAFSSVYRGTDQVCVCFFGDGTANRGPFHEAANAASLWKLPVIWICENNGWAISTSVEQSTSVADLTLRAAGYGMPGVRIDGTDVVAVYDAVSEAVTRARRGDGPTLIEATVDRFRGHFMGDSESYRDKRSDAEFSDRDPIVRAERLIEELALMTQEDMQRLRSSIRQEVEAAAVEALAAPKPSRERIFEGLYK